MPSQPTLPKVFKGILKRPNRCSEEPEEIFRTVINKEEPAAKEKPAGASLEQSASPKPRPVTSSKPIVAPEPEAVVPPNTEQQIETVSAPAPSQEAAPSVVPLVPAPVTEPAPAAERPALALVNETSETTPFDFEAFQLTPSEAAELESEPLSQKEPLKQKGRKRGRKKRKFDDFISEEEETD